MIRCTSAPRAPKTFSSTPLKRKLVPNTSWGHGWGQPDSRIPRETLPMMTSTTGVLGRESDVKGFRPLGIDANHLFGEWFELLGRSEVDALGCGDVHASREARHVRPLRVDVVGGKVEYTATDVSCSKERSEASGPRRRLPAQPSCEAGRWWVPACSPVNFTGSSRYAGTEIDVGLRYAIRRDCSGRHALAGPSSEMPGRPRTVTCRMPGPWPTASSMSFSGRTGHARPAGGDQSPRAQRTPPGRARNRRMAHARCRRRSANRAVGPPWHHGQHAHWPWRFWTHHRQTDSAPRV